MTFNICRGRGGPGPLVPAGLQGAEHLDPIKPEVCPIQGGCLGCQGPQKAPIIAPALGNKYINK